MKRLTLVGAIAFCLLAIAPNLHPVFAKDTWISVRSKNFFLVGNAGEKDIRQVATRLEQFREVFTRLFPGMKFKSPVPTTVIVFKNDSSYTPFKPMADGKMVAVAGYFQAGHDVNYITLTSEKRAEEPYGTIFHEYVHFLVNNTLGKTSAPPWFNEGIAEYYSTFKTEGERKVLLGNPISHHLDLLQTTKLFPLDTLFAVNYHSLERNKHDARGLFYAQSWALIHYLLQGNEGKRVRELGQFVNLLRQNTPAETAFRQAFQNDYVGMLKELKDYTQRRTYNIQVVTFDQKLEFDSEVTTALMTEAEAQAYLGDLLYHIRRIDDAKAKLEQALALDPKLAMAHATLGLVFMEQKKLAEARAHLQQAVTENSTNYLVHYYYAYALSREHMTEGQPVYDFPTETAQTIRAELRRAIELKPDFPESYNLLAFVNLVRGEELDESMDLIKRALSLSPGREEFSFMLAQFYARKQDFDGARKIVEPLAKSGADPQIQANAKGLLAAISSVQEQMARLKANSAAPTSDSEGRPQLRKRAGVADQEENLDPNSHLRQALRKPADGETQVEGMLVKIDCDAKGIVFVIQSGDRLIRLWTKSFQEIDLMTFSPDVAGEITCGARNREKVVVCYVDKSDSRTKTDGTIRSIEFVPKDFVLKQ